MKQKECKQKNTISPEVFGSGLKICAFSICFCEIFINFAVFIISKGGLNRTHNT